MTILGGIGFASPWLLLGLIALPILWLILRAVPPAPIRRRFPGVALLLGLTDDDTVSDRTPWWLLLLRILAVAAMILGLSGPVLNPKIETTGSGPILIVMDASWAGATRWQDKMDAVEAELIKAEQADRVVAILQLTAPKEPVFQTADVLRTRLAGVLPAPWQPQTDLTDEAIAAVSGLDPFDTVWISDGLTYAGHDQMLTALEAKGAVRVFETGTAVIGLQPAVVEDGALTLTAQRSTSDNAREITILANGRDPAGNPATLATVTADFGLGDTATDTALSLPSELRARVTRFEVQGQRTAGAVTLAGDSLQRREIALISAREESEGLQLLSPFLYLNQALVETADILTGSLMNVLPANPDVVVLADVATLSPNEAEALTEWVDAGGLLLRFAGPVLAASDVSRTTEDPLMPVRLRAGGRTVGGSMSWGEPKTLAPFPVGSPFEGLAIPDEVTVTSQVMAQPDPTLADRVIAALSDGTPLVTRKPLGQGQIVLFHVTANTEWSSLPLSVLFINMLDRLAVSTSPAAPDAAELEGTVWTPIQVMDGFGRLTDVDTLPSVDGPDLIAAPLSPDLRPGVYQFEDRLMARNTVTEQTRLQPTAWPARIPVEGLSVAAQWPLMGLLLSAAIVMLLLDVIASLALSGRLIAARAAAIVAALALTGLPQDAVAQEADDFALLATSEVVLAHVITGDTKVDEVALAGLTGLSDTLYFRTSVEPAPPIGVNLETDELAFFPMLYWPVSPNQPTPSAEAYTKLNAYLRSGGMIIFDTRDADTAQFGASSPNGRKLQQLAAALDVPPLEPLPKDHVLTRTFYLLQDFPGRHTSRDVWVEASPPDAEQIEGMPFRNLNDGVTPVIIGGNDWAAAWAVDRSGNPLLPVGRGFSGERQRELAYRFGVNLVMHVLTGNYKSDQVHVPDLLERLGQ
jgi:hypothetical protein